jgi:para-aminobenzoate synthetase
MDGEDISDARRRSVPAYTLSPMQSSAAVHRLAIQNVQKYPTRVTNINYSQCDCTYTELHVTMLVPKPLILFIDAYDSFSNNIVSLLETTLDVSLRTINIDNPALATDDALHEELRHYVAVICGPGPGHPANEKDVGLMKRIWRLGDKQMLPVLGICLGFQSLCLEFGADVKRLKGPQHGIKRRLCHIGKYEADAQQSIFHNVRDITATLYQSLCVDIGQDLIPDDQWQTKKWNPSRRCPELRPLAWAEHDISIANDAGVEDDRVLVAVQHISKPFWALQYHPESICTNAESKKVLLQWFAHVGQWNKHHRQRRLSFQGPIEGRLAVRESLLRESEKTNPWSSQAHTSIASIPEMQAATNSVCHSLVIPIPPNTSVADIVEAMQRDKADYIVLESSNANEKSVGSADVRGRFSIIGLDVDKSPRYEYTARSNRLRLYYGRSEYRSYQNVDTESYGGIWPFLAKHLDERQVAEVVPPALGGKDSPFWGGFMGYTTYELGLETINVHPKNRGSGHSRRPDLCFAWITRSLVIDHVKNIIYIQALTSKSNLNETCLWQINFRKTLEHRLFPSDCFAPSTTTFTNLADGTTEEQLLQVMAKQDVALPHSLKFHYNGNNFTGIATTHYDFANIGRGRSFERKFFLNGHWIYIRDMSRQSRKTAECQNARPTQANKPFESIISTTTPQNAEYEQKVLCCQENIRNGDSYELCLTDQTLVTTRKSYPTSSWDLYKTLRSRQPAPFACYIRLGTATLVSASPERFLKYSSEGKCELRPMKGTVRKSPEVSTLSQATALLDIPKEKAENLMIVDLVRHDLHGVCGSGNVSVPRLMVVEEYKSVFQMISIVQGQIPSPVDPELKLHMNDKETEEATKNRYTGLDVLVASLPPGSMTGAPKKRSCEILQEIEGGKDRSLYSGVVGYMDVAGRGDWSVTIRCMFKWDDEDSVHATDDGGEIESETWHIGAGGAVTALSTAVGEREEMLTKLSGTLGLFRQ